MRAVSLESCSVKFSNAIQENIILCYFIIIIQCSKLAIYENHNLKRSVM